MDEEWCRAAVDVRRAELAAKMNGHRSPVWRLDIYPFTQDALGTIASRATGGDALSSAIIQQVIAIGRRLTEPSPKDRLTCLTCDYVFTTRKLPSYLSVLTSGCDPSAKVRINGNLW